MRKTALCMRAVQVVIEVSCLGPVEIRVGLVFGILLDHDRTVVVAWSILAECWYDDPAFIGMFSRCLPWCVAQVIAKAIFSFMHYAIIVIIFWLFWGLVTAQSHVHTAIGWVVLLTYVIVINSFAVVIDRFEVLFSCVDIKFLILVHQGWNHLLLLLMDLIEGFVFVFGILAFNHRVFLWNSNFMSPILKFVPKLRAHFFIFLNCLRRVYCFFICHIS